MMTWNPYLCFGNPLAVGIFNVETPVPKTMNAIASAQCVSPNRSDFFPQLTRIGVRLAKPPAGTFNAALDDRNNRLQ
jgi:hypothetical protein